MRQTFLLLLSVLLAGCASDLAVRQSELTEWVGRPETELAAAMGAPDRIYEAGGMKFLTYEQRRVEILPGMPDSFEIRPFGYSSALPQTAGATVCDTTFTVAGGVVRAFSLRGNACG